MPPIYTYITILAPYDATITASAIDDYGQVTGTITDVAGRTVGYLYVDGKFFTFSPPAGSASFRVTGLNNLERPAGSVTETDGSQQLFIYDGTRFIETRDTEPGTLSFVGGENDFGDLVGANSSGSWILRAGRFQAFAPPGLPSALPVAINDEGQIVGYTGAADGSPEGFLDTNGSITMLNSANGGLGYGAVPSAISNTGEIVGSLPYALPDGIPGFTYVNGEIDLFFVPNAMYVFPTGVNDLGQIVGNSDVGVFVATPER